MFCDARMASFAEELDGAVPYTACWGAELHGGGGCLPNFVPGKLHFKNNFCDNCRDLIVVPLAQVCALSAGQAACFVNKRSKGFWNHAPTNLGGGQYRIINNTAGCIGPWLALFREQPPHLHWRATSTSNPAPTPPAPRHDTAGCTALGISPCAEPSTRRALCKGVVRSPLSLTPPPILRQADRARQLVD
jgi:hypothetical protein